MQRLRRPPGGRLAGFSECSSSAKPLLLQVCTPCWPFHSQARSPLPCPARAAPLPSAGRLPPDRPSPSSRLSPRPPEAGTPNPAPSAGRGGAPPAPLGRLSGHKGITDQRGSARPGAGAVPAALGAPLGARLGSALSGWAEPRRAVTHWESESEAGPRVFGEGRGGAGGQKSAAALNRKQRR